MKQKMRIVSSMLIISILIQLFIPFTSIATPTITISMSSEATQLKAGDTIKLDVKVSGDQIGSFSGYIDFDTETFKDIKSANIIIPEELQDVGYGDWRGSYTQANKKILVNEAYGEYYTIPNGLLFTIQLVVIKDTDNAVVTLKQIEVDGNNSYYYYSTDVSCTVPTSGEPTPVTYEVKYNINKPAGVSANVDNMPSNTTVEEGQSCTLPATEPSLDGYTFKGWLGSDGNTYAAGSTYGSAINADVTFTAQWEKNKETYPITYDSGVTDNSVTNMPSNGTKTEDEDYTIAEKPSKSGYTFRGWLGSDGTTYNPGDKYQTNAALTLTAQWKKDTALTVNPNGGTWSGSTSTQTFSSYEGDTKEIPDPTEPTGNVIRFNVGTGENLVGLGQQKQTTKFAGWTGGTLSGKTYTYGTNNVTLTANYVGNSVEVPTATKTGSKFLGWADEQGNIVIDKDTTTYAPAYTTPNAPIILTAKFEVETYTVTVDANGGTYNNLPTTTLSEEYNKEIELANPIPPTNGPIITFDYNDETGTTEDKQLEYVFDKWTSSNESSLNGNTYTFATDAETLTAQYKGVDITAPILTRIGYTFEGWYDQATGGTLKYSDGATISSLDQDETVYAHWTANKYNVTFSANDGTINGDTTKEVTYDQAYGTLPTATRPGYDFDGWYNGITKVTAEDIVKLTDDVTLIAGWLGSEFTITFDAKEGQIEGQSTKTVRNEGQYGILPTATRKGYNLDGWYDAENGGNKIESTTRVNLTAPQTLYAHWIIKTATLTIDENNGNYVGEKTITRNYGTEIELGNASIDGYEVTFDGNGGEVLNVTDNKIKQTTSFNHWESNLPNSTSLNGTTYTFGENDETLTAIYTRDAITLPDASKEGATFKGWYISSTSTDDSDKVGEYQETYTPQSDITLYAQWEETTYNLTIDPGEGTYTGTNPITGTMGQEVNIPQVTVPASPSDKIVTFDYDGGNGDVQTIKPEYSLEKWTKSDGTDYTGKTYTFGSADETLTAHYKLAPIDLPQEGNKTGYELSGWKDESTGTLYNLNSKYTVDTSVTLKAIWRAKSYTVNLNKNGGELPEGISETITVIYGSQYGIIPTPTKPGYHFDGWYDQSNTEVKSTDIVNITTDGTTLTAKWTPNSYTLRFNPNGGTLNPEDLTKTVVNGNTYGTLPTPSRDGYEFKGWYTSLPYGDKIISAATVNYTSDPTQEIELIADWKVKKTKLTVDPNGGKWNGSYNVYTSDNNYGTEINFPEPDQYPQGPIINFNGNQGNVLDVTNNQMENYNRFMAWRKQDGTYYTATTYTFGTADETLTAIYETVGIMLPNAERIGATFKGWSTDEAGTDMVGTFNTAYNPATPVTLYAQWEMINYTLTINPGNGTYSGDTSVNGIYDEEINLGIPVGPTGFTILLNNNGSTTPKTQIYNFDGWELKSGKGKIDNNANTFTFEDGDGEIIAKFLSTAIDLTSEIPTAPTGYIFKGWSTDPEGNNIVTSYTPSADGEEVYAQWKPEEYKVTLDAGDGHFNDLTQTKQIDVEYNSSFRTLPVPEKDGYDFVGWFNGNDQINDNDTVNITSDITLTAKWIGKQYTLTFDGNGGTPTETSRNVRNNEKYATLPQASKIGYTFVEWNTAADGTGTTITVDSKTDIQIDTIYAIYEINKYNVIFKNSDGTELKSMQAEYGSSVQYTETTPVQSNVPEGYEARFIGWENESELNFITQDIVLTAKYEVKPIVYTITYNNLKDSDNSANPTTYTIEDSNITLVNLPNQGKIIFKGWYTTEDETGVLITSIDTANLGNIVLYAQWIDDSLYLKSEKYKVGENDIDKYEQGDIYLNKIEPETTVAELINNCETNGTITAYDENGTALTANDLVGTTMTIKVTKNDEEITLILVVMGDIDGDGKATVQDLSELNKAHLGTSELTGARFLAADIDDSEVISATDLSELNKASLGIQKLIYVKPNKQQNV